MIATLAPATDVHNPSKRNKPAPAAITCGVTVCSDAPFTTCRQRPIRVVATITRRRRSPWLGRRSANVGLARFITSSGYEVPQPAANPKGFFLIQFRVGLDFYDPAFDPDHRRVGAIISTQLPKDVPHVAFHRIFSHRERRCNRFIAVSLGN